MDIKLVVFIFAVGIIALEQRQDEYIKDKTALPTYPGIHLNRTKRQVRRSSGHCVLRINEINTDTNKDEPSLFIELSQVCVSGSKKRRQSGKSLKNYYIVVVRAYPPAVVLFANLDDHSLNDDLLFAFGDFPGPKRNGFMDIKHGNVLSIYNNPGVEKSLPVGDDTPYAILLFDTTRVTDLVKFRPTIHFQTKLVEAKQIGLPDMEYILEKESLLADDDPPFLLDMIVYGRKAPVTSCKLFNILWKDTPPHESTRKYIIRDWDISGEVLLELGKNVIEKRAVKDYSLSRCTSSATAFSPSVYQYDDPSPGKHNPCKGAAFFIENYIHKISRIEICSYKPPVIGCTAEHPGVPEGRYYNILEHRFAALREMLIAKQNEEPESMDIDVDCVDETMEIAINHGLVQDYGGTPEEWKIGGSSWEDAWVVAAGPYLPYNGMMLTDPEIQQWLRVKIPGKESPITFHCAACQTFFKDEMGNTLRKKHIQTEKGFFSDTKEINARKIREHLTNDVHISAMNYQLQLAAAKSQEEVDSVRREFENQLQLSLGPTAKMIRTVYTETIAEIPFMYHEHIVNLQRSNGVELGTHHYNANAAAEMTKTISMTMHALLLKHLVANDKPFSLTVDASTTSRNIPLLITYITTLEDGYPTTYFYRLIELEKGESAENTFQSFWNSLLRDDRTEKGFLSYFVSKIAFFVSDSASVMTGLHNSFYTRLKDNTPTKKLGKVGCLAHKMALVIKAAVRDKTDPDFEFLKTFEKDINSFYNFYHSRGSKRWQHLAETAEKHDIKLYRLRQNVEVRWAAAEFEVINNIVKDWKALKDDLEEIAADKTNFLESARTQAQKLYDTLTDTKTCILFYDFLDFLSINSEISKIMQTRASILPDHSVVIRNGFAQYYMAYLGGEGRKLVEFMNEVTCEGVCIQGKCKLEEIENCDAPLYKNVALGHKDDTKYVPVRKRFYEKLFYAMDDYFDFNLLEAVTIFDHRHTKGPIAKKDFQEKFVLVCETFSIENENVKYPGINCDDLKIKAYDFMLQLKASPTFERITGDNDALPPSQFWPYVLKNPANTLDIPEDLRLFFEYLLVFTDSSAEAERGFSIVNRISKDARSSLSPDTIDHLIRIKLNANKPVEEFKAFQYAKEFVKTHYPVDSSEAGGRPMKKPIMDPHRARASRLF